MSKRGVVRKGKYAPIHWVVRKAKLEDGTVRLGMFAMDEEASRQCRERGMSDGSEWKAEIKQVRNAHFWRLVHRLGGWLADNVDDFEGLDAHAALKKVQEKSGIGCDVTRSDIRDNAGNLLYRVVSNQPLSLAFDLMDEGEFRMYWDGGKEARGNGGFLGWIRKRLYPGMNPLSVDEIERMIVGRVVEWVA